MNILVTNDDGIDSPGIYALSTALREIAHVVVMAPLSEQSAVGHALSVHLPLRVSEHEKSGAFFGFAVSGTPADCVKLALRTFLKERGLPQPDLVVSGINNGHNAGISVIYSGTVSAATEAVILGVPAIAVSLSVSRTFQDFAPAAKFMREFVPKTLEMGLPKGTMLNVNVPGLPASEIGGASYTHQGRSYWSDEYEKRLDPQNRPYYWLKGGYEMPDSGADTDDVAIREPRISVTPLHYDLTDYEFLKRLKSNPDIFK